MDVETLISPTLDDTDQSGRRLGKCEVCSFHNAKYTCPKCEVKTCSLKCNKIHKIEVECDGNRDKSRFVQLKKFTNMDFESDFRLLEGISEGIDNMKRKYKETESPVPIHLLRLRSAAYDRRIKLKFLPRKFVRHGKNTTQYNYKSKTIFWHIEWVFTNAENFHLEESRVTETEKLGHALNRHLNNGDLKDQLQYYTSAGLSGLKILLKAEQKGGKKFYELDPTLTIAENLAKKLVIEYPTIHIVLKDHGSGYDVIDSDVEEDKEDIQNGNEVVKRILNRADSDESLYKSLRNLLFISEYSDEEH